MNKGLLLLCMLFALTGRDLWSQSVFIDTVSLKKEGVLVLKTQRGDVFFGRGEFIPSDSLRFTTSGDLELRFKREEIAWLGQIGDAYWLKGSLSDRENNHLFNFDLFGIQGHENLAYSPSAFTYRKGSGEFRNVDLLYNVVDFGVSDHFSIGGGVVIPYFLMARSKFGFPVHEKIHLGAGMTSILGISPDTEGFASHLFVISTFGSPELFFNITAGPAIDWGFTAESPLIITLGGSYSFARNWRVYTDIGLSPGSNGYAPSLLLSWFNRRNRFEFGVLGITGIVFKPFPLLSYALKF